MKKPYRVWENVYVVGGAEISHPYDCSVYLLDAGELALIDCGAGLSFYQLLANIKILGFNPEKLRNILITHAHIDHIGSLRQFRQAYGLKVIAHELDAKAIEEGSDVGARAYGVDYLPCTVDQQIQGGQGILQMGDCQLKIIHIPGHSPGSIAAYFDTNRKRVLFGQDIHGPYLPEWGADPVRAKASLQKLIDVKADILCEGHFGVYEPAPAVEKYIRRYMDSL